MNTIFLSTIQGTWRLIRYGERVVKASGGPPEFTLEGKLITGFDGCNRFGGDIETPQLIVSTQMARVGEYIELPLDLADPKAHLSAARVKSDRLILPARNGYPESVFVKVDANLP